MSSEQGRRGWSSPAWGRSAPAASTWRRRGGRARGPLRRQHRRGIRGQREDRRAGQGLRAGAVHGPPHGAQDRSFRPVRGGGGDDGGAGRRHRRARRRRADRLLDRHRHRRPEDRGGGPHEAVRRRARSAQPLLGHRPDPEHGRRRGVDGAGHARAVDDGVHRMRRVGHVDRERPAVHPRRYGRCDARRRRRGADRAAGAGRFRHDAGAVTPKRRPGGSQQAVRPRPRRVHPGGGRRGAGAGGVGAGAGARRPHPCRGDRLRHVAPTRTT